MTIEHYQNLVIGSGVEHMGHVPLFVAEYRQRGHQITD